MTSILESLEKQKQFLLTTVKECQQKETERLKRLTLVKQKSEHDQLMQRHLQERQQDQQHIEHLSNDYFVLKQKLESGELQKVEEHRIHSGRNRRKEVIAELQPNRFVGLEDYNGQIFYADVVRKFDNHDRRNQAKEVKPTFDVRGETNKVKPMFFLSSFSSDAFSFS
jgi:hypothetical protein